MPQFQFEFCLNRTVCDGQHEGKRRNRVFFERISPSEQNSADGKLAELVYGNGLPLSLVESPYFCRFSQTAYRLPTRLALSTTLLDEHYERLSAEIQNKISEANSVSIIVDAWTTCKNESIVGFSVATPRPYFLKAIFTGTTRHTADFFFGKIASRSRT